MNGLQLPDNLPPKWLEQIRQIVKPTRTERIMSVLGMILGSGVIAGLIASGASFVMLKPIANADLEKTRAAEKRQVLGDLRNHLALLNTELDNIPDATQLSKNPNLWTYAKKSIDQATEEMAVLKSELNDSRIDRATAEKIAVVLDQLGPRMQPALDGIAGTKALAELYEHGVSEDIRKLQRAIDDAIQGTKL
jgi:hypothetical protein